MRFETLEAALELIALVRKPLEALRSRDPDLHRQIRAAASSLALNLAEGNRRAGKDRLQHFRIAAGSADEARTGLRVAVAWGDLEGPAVAEALRLLDRILGMAWGLTRGG